ncbi:MULTISPECIES: hypothetical protein [unclassified Microcoleus]|uniref:hypothetical protein n=1 Tax=unclassified Microcoleus TaxID=2642155 RepID=UPI0025E28C7C|nr:MULTISPECIES: hypothetical protein [unclassified Microcoleus]
MSGRSQVIRWAGRVYEISGFYYISWRTRPYGNNGQSIAIPNNSYCIATTTKV